MGSLKISVIIPTYGGAEFIGDAIKSVLKQTYSNFELIIVNDASPDHTTDIVNQYDDPRIKYYIQPFNQGVDAARLFAIQNSNGEILAFLDQDDYFHPEKLQEHVKLFETRPDVGFTYNARYEINHPAKTIRGVAWPPRNLGLADLLLGFPIAPSDWMMRREWANFMDLSSESMLINGGEYVITGHLYLSGCIFASIDRVLNYRRYQSGRIHSKLRLRCINELTAQQRIFDDPRCPPEVKALQPKAHKNTYRMWAYYAFSQGETTLGQEFLRKAVQFEPAILAGFPCEIADFFLTCSLDDEKVDHKELLKKIFAQLPSEMGDIQKQYDWAVGRGFLIKGIRACLWDYPEGESHFFEQALRMKAQIDDSLISFLIRNLLDVEAEFGEMIVRKKIQALLPIAEKIGGTAASRQLIANYSFNHAFYQYSLGEYSKVPGSAFGAIMKNPKFLVNRGILSLAIRSILMMNHPTSKHFIKSDANG